MTISFNHQLDAEMRLKKKRLTMVQHLSSLHLTILQSYSRTVFQSYNLTAVQYYMLHIHFEEKVGKTQSRF